MPDSPFPAPLIVIDATPAPAEKVPCGVVDVSGAGSAVTARVNGEAATVELPNPSTTTGRPIAKAGLAEQQAIQTNEHERNQNPKHADAESAGPQHKRETPPATNDLRRHAKLDPPKRQQLRTSRLPLDQTSGHDAYKQPRPRRTVTSRTRPDQRRTSPPRPADRAAAAGPRGRFRFDPRNGTSRSPGVTARWATSRESARLKLMLLIVLLTALSIVRRHTWLRRIASRP